MCIVEIVQMQEWKRQIIGIRNFQAVALRGAGSRRESKIPLFVKTDVQFLFAAAPDFRSWTCGHRVRDNDHVVKIAG